MAPKPVMTGSASDDAVHGGVQGDCRRKLCSAGASPVQLHFPSCKKKPLVLALCFPGSLPA